MEQDPPFVDIPIFALRQSEWKTRFNANVSEKEQ